MWSLKHFFGHQNPMALLKLTMKHAMGQSSVKHYDNEAKPSLQNDGGARIRLRESSP